MTDKTLPRRTSPGGAGVSIRAVAKHAGVSTATVSRALRFPEQVIDETRKRVIAAVEELGYQPNAAARNLRMRRAHAVIVLVPTIANPFYAPIIRGAERVASARGYCVLLGDTENDSEKERRLAQLALNSQVDGIFQLGGRWPAGYPVTDVARVCFVNACELFDTPLVSSVAIDNVGAAETLTEFLIGLGHRSVAIVTGPSESSVTRDRLVGVERALSRIGVAPASITAGDYSMRSGADAADRLHAAAAEQTVVFCFNDEMALGVMHRFAALGLRIPQDIGVCGFDDIDVARFCSPGLTTMAQPKELIGERAMTMLLDSIEGKEEGPIVYRYAAKLVERASVLPVEQMTRRSR